MFVTTYLAHGGQMTGDEMAIITVAVTMALGLPAGALTFVFLRKRRSQDARFSDLPDDSYSTALSGSTQAPSDTEHGGDR